MSSWRPFKDMGIGGETPGLDSMIKMLNFYLKSKCESYQVPYDLDEKNLKQQFESGIRDFLGAQVDSKCIIYNDTTNLDFFENEWPLIFNGWLRSLQIKDMKENS